MKPEEKEYLIKLIENYAMFNNLYREHLDKAINSQPSHFELFKELKDEKFAEIKSIIEAI